MKKLTILPCLFLVFTSCQKTAQNLSDYVNAAVQTDATAAMIGFTFDNGLQGWGKANRGYVGWVENAGRGLPKGSLGGEDLASADPNNDWWSFAAPDTALKVIQNFGALGLINFKLKFDIRLHPTWNSTRRDYDGGYVWVRCPSFNMFRKDELAPIYDSAIRWKTLEIPLNSGWYVGEFEGSNHLATKSELLTAWSTITHLLILGDWYTLQEYVNLDNVMLEKL
jgi:hypothetical protein